MARVTVTLTGTGHKSAPGYLIKTTMQGSLASHEEQDRRLLVLYATETGTAQDVADRVARALRNLNLRSQVISVDNYFIVRKPFIRVCAFEMTVI